jgi:hypothetical protein
MPREPGEFKEVFEVEDAKCTAETSKAILVEHSVFDGGKAWIPKSQVSNDSEVREKGTDGTLIISKWLAEQNSWL